MAILVLVVGLHGRSPLLLAQIYTEEILDRGRRDRFRALTLEHLLA